MDRFVTIESFTDGLTTMSISVPGGISSRCLRVSLTLLLKRFLSTAHPLFLETENPRRIRPRVFPEHTIFRTEPLNLHPSLKTLSNSGLPESRPGAFRPPAPLRDEELPVPAASGIQDLAAVPRGHPGPEAVSSRTGKVAGLKCPLHLSSPGRPARVVCVSFTA